MGSPGCHAGFEATGTPRLLSFFDGERTSAGLIVSAVVLMYPILPLGFGDLVFLGTPPRFSKPRRIRAVKVHITASQTAIHDASGVLTVR